MDFSYDSCCFACGEHNPDGLQLKFRKEGDKIVTIFVPPAKYQGWPGILHGGITGTVFDDIMSRCITVLGVKSVSVHLETKFMRKIPVEKPLYVEAWLTGNDGRKIQAEAKAYLEDGLVAAEGKGLYIVLKE